MQLDDPFVVDHGYRSMDRFGSRGFVRTAWLRGQPEWTVALSAIAEIRPVRVLDAGSGTADFAALIAAPQRCCVDSSPAAAAATRARGRQAQLATMEQLPFRHDWFDLVTCNWTPYHLPEQDRGIRELARVLRPGGRFVGIYNFPDHREEVWHTSGIVWEASGFDAESGERQLPFLFQSVSREETGGDLGSDDHAGVQAYVGANLGLAGPLTAPDQPFECSGRRHDCVFIAVKA